LVLRSQRCALPDASPNYIQPCVTADPPANHRVLEVATFAIRQVWGSIELFKDNDDRRMHSEPVQE
jgi:hypothetical protein